jgi:nitroreductase
MTTNTIIEVMLRRKSIRKYREDSPSDEVIAAIVRAGQQAPFASQLYSILLKRKKEKLPYGAPLLFTICVDIHKLETIMARRKWKVVTNDYFLLLLGIQDAVLVAENMVMAAESLGLGSCFLGNIPNNAHKVIEEYRLPKRVFPLVELIMGYPAEDPPPRPRYPLEFVLFEDRYPQFDDDTVNRAMRTMDDGYQAQDYYRNPNAMIELAEDREETFTLDSYSWTEHISRKWGQWWESSEGLLEQFRKCGFDIGPGQPRDQSTESGQTE